MRASTLIGSGRPLFNIPDFREFASAGAPTIGIEMDKTVRRDCPCCGEAFTGHPNKRFCGQVCKDRWHNATNPRGKQAGMFEPYVPLTRAEADHQSAMDADEEGWDGHKNAW